MKKHFLLGAISFILGACTNMMDEITLEIDTNPSQNILSFGENGYEVTQTDISNIINAHGDQTSRSNSASVSTISDADGINTMYVINYGVNDGWQIVSASKNVSPILAYSETGHFDVSHISQAPLGLTSWIENSSSIVKESYKLDEDSVIEVRKLWKRYSSNRSMSRAGASDYNPKDILKYISKDEYDKLIQIMNDSIYSWNKQGWDVQICDKYFLDENPELLDDALGTIFGPYTDAVCELTFKLHKTWADVHSNQLIKTIWHQGSPYNQSFPYVEGLGTAYVGCVPLAIGQLMRYYEYPVTYNWSSMPYDYATTTTSDFLLELAEMANAKYKDYGTSVKLDNAKKVFSNLGYSTSKTFDYTYGDRLPSIGIFFAKLTIKDECKPWFTDGGHSWISGGSSSVTEWEQTVYYTFRERLKMDTFNDCWPHEICHAKFTYMIWGWASGYNGFFSDYTLSCPIAQKIQDIKYFTVEKPKQ